MEEKNFFKMKGVTYAFAAVSLLGGFLFLNKGITGNLILNRQFGINVVSLIGLLLIICSAILFAYSIKKR